MAGSHAHGSTQDIALARGPVRLLLGFLAVCAVATVVAVVALWPDEHEFDELRQNTQYAAPGVTFPRAEVTQVLPPCPDTRSVRPDCGQVSVELDEGPERGTTVQVQVSAALVRAGLDESDKVLLQRVQGEQGPIYSFDGVVRHQPLALMAVLFVLVVGAVARLRGLLALVSLGLGGLLLFRFMLPGLLTGGPGLGIALAGSAAIMFVVLYLSHGPTVRTSAALAGTLVGVAMTAGIGELAVQAATLTGVSDDGAAQLTAYLPDLSFQGLLMCALVVAGLGVLNDVTITQASAVWELRAAGPMLGRVELFRSGMRIGRDHIASTIYTIVFAYAGSALAVLLLLTLYDRPVLDVLTTEAISEEIVRTLASGIGLVLAVPVTTAIAAITVGPPVLTPEPAPAPALGSALGSAPGSALGSAQEDEVSADGGRHQA